MKKLTLLLVLFAVLITTSFAHARDSVELGWDPNSDANYYVVSWGETAETYANSSPRIPEAQTRFTVPNLDPNLTYYFAVKAYNECGNSSDYSERVTACGDIDNAAVVTPMGNCFIINSQTE